MEIVQELPTVDYILAPIGGGGLITGVSTLAKMLNPKIKVIGVEPAEAASMTAAIEAGHTVTLPSANTIADGTAVQTPGKIIFPYIQENLDDIITVEDEELIPCFLDLLENHKMLAENSGLLTIAALKHLDVKNKKVVSIISGGNMDVITIASLVQHGLIMRDRIFTVSVFLPDKPGELTRVSQVIAETQGNIVKLEHNQFVSINRNSAVELTITMEAFGSEHKNKIIKVLEYKDHIPCCSGMIQKEVAERMAAPPGSKTYGILSVLLQAWYEIEYLFTVPEHVFNPPPKVKSAVIKMTRNQVRQLGCNEPLFKRIVKTAFNQRRKTMRNSLKSMVGQDCKILAEPIFNERPERLSVKQFIDLTNLLESYIIK